MKLKRVVLILSGIFSVFVIAALAIPLLVDVDKYRPLIVEKVNSQINGRIELGKLTLSLWGRIKVDISGLELLDSKSRKVVSVKDASFLLPFSSVLGGSPKATLALVKPSLAVFREANGQFNVMTLMRKPESAATPVAESGKTPTAAREIQIPAVVARARFGLDIRDGALRYVDEQKKFESAIDRLQLQLKDASITQPTHLIIGADLDTRMGQDLRLIGPVSLEAHTTPVVSGGELKEMSASIVGNGSDLKIEIPGLFEKKKGVDLSMSGKLGIGLDDVRIDSMVAKFHSAELSLTGKVDQLAKDPQLALSAKTNSIDLSGWGELIPMLQAFKLTGKSSLEMQVGGSATALRYNGKLEIDSVGFSHPKLKAQPRLDGRIQIATNQIEGIQMKLTAPGSELKVTGKLQDFLKPKITLSLDSSAMDLDQWVDFSKPKAVAERAAKPETAAAQKKEVVSAVQTDLDALLDPVRKNQIAVATDAKVDVSIDKIKAYQVSISKLRARATLQNLLFNLESASFDIFDGKISSSSKLDMKPARPTYSFAAKVDGLQIQKAVESQIAFLKNTLIGRLQAQVSGSGVGFNPEPAIKAINMKGFFEVRQGRFATIDITKVAFDGINQAIAKAADKVPVLKGRQLGAIGSKDSSYDVIRSDFQMANGKFTAPNFVAKAEANKGLDLTGSVAVDLKDQTLQTRFEVVDTYNLTKAKDLSVDVAGVQVQHVLAEKGKPVRIPISVGCSISKPCPSYLELPEHFSKVALANLSGAAGDKAKSEAKKAVGEALKKGLPGGLKKLFR